MSIQHYIVIKLKLQIRQKENKIMGISCKKPVGKFQSIMKKMDNQLEAERKAAKEKKESKKSKK